MVDLGTLLIGVKVDKDNAVKGLNDVGKEVTEKENSIGKSMLGIGKAIAAAFSVAAIVNFGKKIVEASADIQAMDAQFNQVFKDDTAAAMEKINEQADVLGIHADRLTVSFNKFGGQVKGAGMDSEKALEATTKATSLAADAAAFYDVSLEDASGSIASFMKGNFEAGDAIGVFTNAKQMDIKSNEMYGKAWADLTEAERQYLLLDTVSKTYELNGAMGQAQRESESYSNVLGNLKATFQRLYSVIGAPVLDAFLQVVQFVAAGVESLQSQIEDGTISFNGFNDMVMNVYNWLKEQLTPIIEKLYTVFKDNLLPILQRLYDWIVLSLPTMQSIAEIAFKIMRNIVEAVCKAFDLLTTILNVLFDWIEPHFPTIQRITENTFKAIGKAVETVTGIFNGIVDAIKTAIEWLSKWNKADAKDKKFSTTTDYYDGSHADGLNYVPYDNYIAELHKGERVLTAKENNNLNNLGAEIVNGLASVLNRPTGNNNPINLILNIDGKQFARATYNDYQNESIRRGALVGV